MALIPPPAVIPRLLISFKTRGVARMNDIPTDAENADLEFREKRPDVLKRDKYTCSCCGIVANPGTGIGGIEAGEGLEVHHLSGDHHENQYENLITLCPICHALLHFWFSATKGPYRESMRIVYLPWLSQENLNLLSWGIAVAQYRCAAINQENIVTDLDVKALEIGENGREIADAIITLGKIPPDFFGGDMPGESARVVKNMENAATLAMAMLEIARNDKDAFSDRESLLRGVRVFFHPDHLEGPAAKFSAMPAWLPGPGSKWAETWQAASKGRRIPL